MESGEWPAGRQLAFLLRAADALAGTTDPIEVLATAARLGSELTGWCSVELTAPGVSARARHPNTEAPAGEPIALPLITGEISLGQLTLVPREAFDPGAGATLAKLADWVARALQTARRFQLERQARQASEHAAGRLVQLQASTLGINLTVSDGNPFGAILQALTDEARVLTGARFAAATVSDETGPTATPVETMSGSATAGTAPRMLSMPIVDRSGRTVGNLRLGERSRAPEKLEAEDEEILRYLTRLATIALENWRHSREAASAIRVREDFIATASHELRTPLTALTLQVEALRRVDELAPRVASRAKSIGLQIDRLNKLIDSLLDVSRMGSGRLDLRLEDQVDLASVARDVISRFDDQLAWAACPITLNIDQPVMGRWDRLRVDQAVTNLLSNALKYGHGKPIEISVIGHERMGRFVIKDQGVGIATGDQLRIFDRFERATRSDVGFGLGLWIVRQIADAHGGRIHVSSQPGQGSTFMLDLPCAAHGAATP